MIIGSRKTALFFLLAAFLLNALLPFYALYQWSPREAMQATASVLGEKVLICTGQGFKLVRWQDLAQGKEKLPSHPQFKCPLCYVTAHGQGISATSPVPELIGNEYSIADIRARSNDTIFAEQAWQKRRTRSPPSSVL